MHLCVAEKRALWTISPCGLHCYSVDYFSLLYNYSSHNCYLCSPETAVKTHSLLRTHDQLVKDLCLLDLLSLPPYLDPLGWVCCRLLSHLTLAVPPCCLPCCAQRTALCAILNPSCATLLATLPCPHYCPVCWTQSLLCQISLIFYLSLPNSLLAQFLNREPCDHSCVCSVQPTPWSHMANTFFIVNLPTNHLHNNCISLVSTTCHHPLNGPNNLLWNTEIINRCYVKRKKKQQLNKP